MELGERVSHDGVVAVWRDCVDINWLGCGTERVVMEQPGMGG